MAISDESQRVTAGSYSGGDLGIPTALYAGKDVGASTSHRQFVGSSSSFESDVGASTSATLYAGRPNPQQSFYKQKRDYTLLCDVYKMKGHTKDTCYRVVGYPPDYKFKKKPGPARYGSNGNGNMMAHVNTIEDNCGSGPAAHVFTQEQYSHLLRMLNKENNDIPVVNQAGIKLKHWVVDSGATKHTTSSLDELFDIVALEQGDQTHDLPTRKVKGIGKETGGLYFLLNKGVKDGSHLNKAVTAQVEHNAEATTAKFLVSRDVVFKESVFPFKSLHKDSSLNLFPDTSQLSELDVITNPTPDIPVIPTMIEDDSDDGMMHNAIAGSNERTRDDVEEPVIMPAGTSERTHDDVEEPVIMPHIIRKSSRVMIKPTWHQDYVTTTKKKVQQDRQPYSLSNYVSYQSLSPEYMACLSKFSAVAEPNSYEEAVQDIKWIDVMQYELQALADNGTWNLVPWPQG
ncbi:hypothetical protein KY289_017223 [Solanum tuberosum]|nr:hypothetical protein KY289_017223 [Solanum tuberosum]